MRNPEDNPGELLPEMCGRIPAKTPSGITRKFPVIGILRGIPGRTPKLTESMEKISG